MIEIQGAPAAPDFRTTVVKSALQFGAVTGGVGCLVGGTAGIIRGSPSFLFATASGLQTFALGGTFSATRSVLLGAWNTGPPSSIDLVKASSAAGAVSGAAIALITRGRSNVIPAGLMWSLFGCLGQLTVNGLAGTRNVDEKGFWRSFTERKWSPISYVSNEDYAKILNERMLKLDVEIAIVDDKIAALKHQQQQDQMVQTQAKKVDIERRISSPSK